MPAETHTIDIPIPIIQYGYFLYVWKSLPHRADLILYVGRTGDDVYTAANPPVVRIGQHLGRGPAASLINNLVQRRVKVRESAQLRIIIHGPIFQPPQGNPDAHDARVTPMKALERALREALQHNGYTVVGTHPRNWNLCRRCWQGVQRPSAALQPQRSASRQGH